jgi:hypothetical protein
MTADHLAYAVATVGKLMHDQASTDRLDAHCRWELGEMFKRIRIADLLSAEVIALAAILAPVHSRVIIRAEVAERPQLSVIHCNPDDNT